MQHLAVAALAVLAKTIHSAPLQHVQDYTFQLVGPRPEFSIKVPNQLYIAMCQDLNFGPPCVGGTVAPGLCYATPAFGVTAVQPGKEISGCTLYQSGLCDTDAALHKIQDVAYPGIGDLTQNGLNDQINSFICY